MNSLLITELRIVLFHKKYLYLFLKGNNLLHFKKDWFIIRITKINLEII